MEASGFAGGDSLTAFWVFGFERSKHKETAKTGVSTRDFGLNLVSALLAASARFLWFIS